MTPNEEEILYRLEKVKKTFPLTHSWHMCLIYAIGEIKDIINNKKDDLVQ